MVRHPILAAVDTSAEAAAAAEFAWRLANTAGVRCQLVHAVRDPWAAAFLAEVPDPSPEFTRLLFAAARTRIGDKLQGRVPAQVLDELIVQAGAAADVINAVARDLHADLIVLGGKHHSLLGRWLGGSTALNVARTTATPILVTAGEPVSVRRVLVALDTSGAAPATFEAARRLAHTHGAQLRALSIIEPLPVMPESVPTVDPAPYISLCRDTIDAELRPLVAPTGAELIVQIGPTARTIEDEAKAWHADLVVVGSHGKSWTQRLMLGSVTERLLNHLPASLVVVPVGAREPAAVPARALEPGMILTAAIG